MDRDLYGEKHYPPFQQLGPEQEWQKMDKVNTSIQQRHGYVKIINIRCYSQINENISTFGLGLKIMVYLILPKVSGSSIIFEVNIWSATDNFSL